jgi:putative ATP-dependent endonuclease of OLD family
MLIRVQELSEKFEDIKNLFCGVEQFAAFVNELQTQVAELSGNLEHALSVDFSAYDPSRPFHAMRVFPYQEGEVRTFEELGTGQEQILALSFAYAYAKAFHGQGEGLLLVIEEPEAHLHPLAQRWVGRKIYELAKEGIQVVVTTHSPAFLDVEHLEGIILVRKESGATTVTQLTKGDLSEYCQQTGAFKADADSILPFYAAAATEEILSGLFARQIVLVEGPTEALALPVYFERLGLNPTKEGVAFIAVHGVGNLAKWWRFFTAYEIPTYVIFDNDAKDDKEGTKRADVLTALEYPQHKQGEVLDSHKWYVTQKFAVLGVNFEETMRRCFGEAYSDLEQEALDTFELSMNQSKPLVARFVASRIELDEECSAVKLFQAVIKRIETTEA